MAVKMADSATLVSYDFGAFASFLNFYGTTTHVLDSALRFSPLERQTESQVSSASSQSQPEPVIVAIDETALLLGFVAAGVHFGSGQSSAVWLVEWLKARGVDPEKLIDTPQAPIDSGDSGVVEGVPSDLLRNRILPAAVGIAKRTVGREKADARHLLWALVQATPNRPGPLRDIFSVDSLAAFNEYMRERLESSHEEGEDLEAWRGLISEPAPAESVGTLSDAPALVDALGRQAFAEVLATRVTQVYETLRSGKLGNDSAFILHIDGPWGSGKSSVLNFLKTNLEGADPKWLIVEFNAWRNQQRSPAWWPIISHVWATVRREGAFNFPRAYGVWMRWTMGMRWLPLVLSGLLIVVFAVLVYWWGRTPAAADGDNQWIELMDKAWKGVLALMALGGFAWTSTRAMFFGSKSAAETYVQSSAEPYRPIVGLYERLVRAIGRPVAVFIDDIDRCDSSYVIDLLEGIQTLLRSAPVVYVVAGDRKWICSSFEKRYIDFGGQIGVPGRPLGYLFLDKVFQLSTAIPRLSTLRQAAYWRRLLETGQSADDTREEMQRLETKAEQELKGKTSHEDIQKEIDRTEEGSLERETIRAAAAKQITSPEAIRAAEHRLQPLAGLLEPNPRSMKRLVNAYGLNHARAFLEGRTVAVEALARWTIVELRWPILADYMATNWSDFACGNLTAAQFPEGIRALLADSDVKEVFGRDGEVGRLVIETLSPILE